LPADTLAILNEFYQEQNENLRKKGQEKHRWRLGNVLFNNIILSNIRWNTLGRSEYNIL
jgi:hypothetical protein